MRTKEAEAMIYRGRRPGAVDLSECEQQVEGLEMCDLPLSADLLAAVRGLREQVCAAPWETNEERRRAYGLTRRLVLLEIAGGEESDA
jgi:hypothetical protein